MLSVRRRTYEGENEGVFVIVSQWELWLENLKA